MKEQNFSILDILEVSIKGLGEYTWQGVGLLLFYLTTIAFLVYFFSELYADKFEISEKKKWIVILIGMTFGVLDLYLGSNQINFPIWGILALLLYYDAKYQELPDAMNLVIAVIGIPIAIQSFFTGSSYLEWTLLSSVVLFVIFVLIALAGPLGGGDIKMMAAVGLYFPLYEVPQLIFFGVAAGVIHAIYLLIFTDAGMKTQFAFGPGLIVGILLTSIF